MSKSKGWIKKLFGEEVKQDIVRLVNLKKYTKKRKKEKEWVGCDGKKYYKSLKPFENKKCIFIHIPKAAGLSVTYSLFGQMTGGHKSVETYRKIFGRKFHKYFKFTFVRNPYERIASAYNYLRDGGHPAFPNDIWFKKNVINKFEGFDHFVKDWLKVERENWYMPHFVPQNRFLKYDGEIKVDFIGKIESIKNDFNKISNKIGVNSSISHVNKSSKSNYYEMYKNEETAKKVKEVYHEDFLKFGYSKNIKNIR